MAHACIPLRFEKGSRGVLNVADRPGQLFTEDELRFLETLGHQIGLAVERARHLQAERVRNQEARAMAAITKAIGGSLDIPSILRGGGEDRARAARRPSAPTSSSAPTRGGSRVAQLGGPAAPGAAAKARSSTSSRWTRGSTVRCLEERATFTIDDWSTDPRVNRALAERWQTRSGARWCPSSPTTRRSGCWSVTAAQPRHWTEEQVDVAEALAAQAAVALENARLYEEARAA